MEKKGLYTEEELEIFLKWFNEQKLPKTMQIDDATYTPDLKETIISLTGQARLCFKNPKMQGCIHLLNRIKSKLEEQANPFTILIMNGLALFFLIYEL